MMRKRSSTNGDTDFGIFYPHGYIVAAFHSQEDAQRVQDDLFRGGYEAADCIVVPGSDVATAATRNLSTHRGWLSRLGKSDEAVRLHLDAANGGATFLRIFAPNDTDAERVMNVIRRAPFSLAHRYQRFAIQHMT
jgi:hypothetical protein